MLPLCMKGRFRHVTVSGGWCV